MEEAKKMLKVSINNFLWIPSLIINFNNSYNSPFEMQEHEQALVDAIARLGDASDGESGNN